MVKFEFKSKLSIHPLEYLPTNYPDLGFSRVDKSTFGVCFKPILMVLDSDECRAFAHPLYSVCYSEFGCDVTSLFVNLINFAVRNLYVIFGNVIKKEFVVGFSLTT